MISQSIQRRILSIVVLSLSLPVFFTGARAFAVSRWETKLDGRARFYLPSDLGPLIVGTEKSLYALEAATGEVLWRRKNVSLDETDVAPVPGTDLVLLSLESGNKSRVEAIDILTGDPLWRSEKVRGSVMQMAFDHRTSLLAVVFVRNARGKSGEELKRKPVIYGFDVRTGKELWKRELEDSIEMMPARWSDGGDVPFTLDNYRPPVFLDNRLYTFYDGLTSQDAFTGKERRREKFRINENGLALTEADPLADERYVYISGKGRIRAISRSDGEEVWEAKDLGSVPEMILTRGVVYARTGGQFARLKDGESVSRGPYGLSAINSETGKVLWRYKGADRGITNFILADSSTIFLADRDDLIVLDAQSGKRRRKIEHKVEAAAFVLLNERGEALVGGKNELAAFDLGSGENVWRARHNPPGRGLLRTVAAVAARATALYFRYGGTATTAFRGVQLLNAMSSLRWSGLAAREALPSLSSLASTYARDYGRERITAYGLLSRSRETRHARGYRLPRPSVDVEDRLLDRIDPASHLERLSRSLMRTRRLAELRGDYMYFYTALRGGNGLAGVNINTGLTEREVRMPAPDERFFSDEELRLLFVSQGDRMMAFGM